jgi:ribosome-interacting GTPase 1
MHALWQQYKIHHAEITLRQDVTVDELIDIIGVCVFVRVCVCLRARA